MMIEIYSKNFALVNSIEVPDGIIPRVGETVKLNQDVGYLAGQTELLVQDVVYVLEANRLIPVVKCHAAGGEVNRRDLLESKGWL